MIINFLGACTTLMLQSTSPARRARRAGAPTLSPIVQPLLSGLTSPDMYSHARAEAVSLLTIWTSSRSTPAANARPHASFGGARWAKKAVVDVLWYRFLHLEFFR